MVGYVFLKDNCFYKQNMRTILLVMTFGCYLTSIIVAVAAKRQFKEATELEVKQCISAWLQQARFRVSRRFVEHCNESYICLLY